jgi:hypothetical protein
MRWIDSHPDCAEVVRSILRGEGEVTLQGLVAAMPTEAREHLLSMAKRRLAPLEAVGRVGASSGFRVRYTNRSAELHDRNGEIVFEAALRGRSNHC